MFQNEALQKHFQFFFPHCVCWCATAKYYILSRDDMYGSHPYLVDLASAKWVPRTHAK